MKTDALPASTLDFNPTVGMTIEGAAPDDPDNDPWHVTMALAPRFAGPPLHVHPHQEESFEVLSGVLDVCVAGEWRELVPGERITMPAGTSHTIRNLYGEELRALNAHIPALGFPDYMAGLHKLVRSGKVRALPPKDPRSMIYLSMLFTAYERTLIPIKPPQQLMRILASVGNRLGYRITE